MDERRKLIVEELILNGTIYVRDLAEKLSVTSETIRKDLNFLEKQGFLIKSHGGATLKQNTIEHSFQFREKENLNLKKMIAKKALDLLPINSTLIIGTGSTTLELAKLLSFTSGHKIFTDSLPVANVLIHSNNKVMLFGGELREKSSSVFGGWTVSMINSISVDICFIGSDGFVNFNGPTSPSSSDTFVDQAIINRSSRKYILADHTKFNRKSLYQICDWSDVTALITDKNADKEHVDNIREKTEVIICN